jgi:hypothetical protein
MHYNELGHLMWPPETSPKAWRYSSNGGPPGWCMPMGKALRALREAGIAHEKYNPNGGRGDVCLLSNTN